MPPLTVRNVYPGLIDTALAINVDRLARVGSNVHLDVTQVTTGDFTAPVVSALTTLLPTNAVDLPTSIALCNAIRQILLMHMADAVSTDATGIGSHKTPDTTQTANLGAVASDLASVVTAVNAHKAAYNAHLSQANVHYTNDATNTVATANATDLASSETLLNAMKAAMTAHVAGALAGYGVRIGPA